MIDILRLLALISDTQEMVAPEDKLTETLKNAGQFQELDDDTLEELAAAGNPALLNNPEKFRKN